MFRYTFILFLILFTSIEALDLPEFLHVCSRNDPNINECIKASVVHLRPYLVKGVPEYNIPTLEPLLLKEVIVAGNGGISLRCTNVKAYGASDFVVTKMNAQMEKLVFDLELILTHLYVDSDYIMDGKVLLLPIHGNGRLTGNFTNTHATVRFVATADSDASGVQRFHIKNFDLKVVVKDGSLNLDNLFNGDKVIGEVINNAINANFDAFLRELMPMIEKALSEAFIDISNSIVNAFTFDQLWPK